MTSEKIRLFCPGLNKLIPLSINPLQAKFYRGNINIYLHIMSLLHIDMTQVLKNTSSSKTRTYLLCIVNIMAADVLAT